MPQIRTRFAPSPTGFLHIGGLRTALYAYALAKHHNGNFILRIEDTDQKREVAGATAALQETLRKFGINWDEFYLQSNRLGLYQTSAYGLIANGHAFYCQCPPKNVKTDGFSVDLRDPCRDKQYTSGAIKLKVPDHRQVSYYDFVHKKDITWDTDTVYDATLLKTDGFPTYHLAAMVDDLDMHISHILRGHDWLPSTPVHLLVFEFLANTRPEIGHLSDILSASTGKKLSKRRDSVFVENFLSDGYLPEALLNFVMLLGWAPKDNRELFTLSEFTKHFEIAGFQEANPRFLMTKLDWFNGHYLRQKPDDELTQLIKPYFDDPRLPQILPLIKDRLVKTSDVNALTSFFISAPLIDSGLFPDKEQSLSHLKYALVNFDNLDVDNIKANNWKVGDFFMSLRIAICGSRSTPPINETMHILGKPESLSRIQTAINALS